MRIADTVVIFFVGVFAVSNAKNLLVNENQVDRSSSSSSSSEEDSKDLTSYVKQVQKMCFEKTNSNDAFQAVMVAVYGVPQCIQGMVDVSTFVDNMRNLNASTRHELFPKYCPQVRSALVCLNTPKEELRKCLDANDAVILDGMVNAMPDAVDLICKDDGEILYQDNANYNVCMRKYSDYAMECARLVSSETDLMEVSNFGQAQCDELANVRNCMEGKFNECNGPRVMEVFDVFWRALIQVTPCKNFVSLSEGK